MRPRKGMLAAAVALGALTVAACQPVAPPPPPPPPQVNSCDAPIQKDGKTEYYAVVDEGDGTPRAVSFDAGSDAEKHEDVARIEATQGDVISVAPDRLVQSAVNPNPSDDSQYVNQWGVDAAGFPTAWGVGHASSQGASGGASVRVAVLDTGAYQGHEDLGSAAVVTGLDETVLDTSGKATPGGTSDPNGHGTHVAGILGARDNTVGGVGGAPDVEIVPIRVLNASGSGSYSGVMNGIYDAVTAGAKVISMSLGGWVYDQALQDAVTYAVDHGVAVVAAAGNNGTCRASYPAAMSGVISVAALAKPVNPSDAPTLASYSQRGAIVDVAAPGSSIVSTVNPTLYDPPTTLYGQKSGTSMATPFVAAAAALLIARFPGITPCQVEATLESTAAPIAGNPVQTSPPSGALRIDQATALAAPAPC